MMKKNTLLKVLLLLAPVFLFFTIQATAGEEQEKHPEVDFSMSCKACHKTVTPDIHDEWKASAHGKMNFACYMCHGDGKEEFHVKPGSERCVSCHSDQEVDFSKTKLSNCFDCHQGHSLKFHQAQ